MIGYQYALRLLLAAPEIVIEHSVEPDTLLAQEDMAATNHVDRMVAWSGLKAGCRSIMTFDRKAAKTIPGMELLV